jgi:predicted amidohydrolase YtcJ
MAANRSVYRAVALRDEWTVAVSADPHGLDGLISSDTRVIDEPGLTILPTFDDDHNHFILAAENLGFVQADQAHSIAELVDAYERVITDNPGLRPGQIFPIRSWVEAGVQVSAGSDSPPTSVDPMQAIWGMVMRGTKQIGIQGAEQAIDQYTAMQLYTAASAELNWESERRGTIHPHRLADLMAYRTDPITCPVDQLLGLRPVFTLVGGRAVYDPESIFAKPN